jgi:hypothetical protein
LRLFQSRRCHQLGQRIQGRLQNWVHADFLGKALSIKNKRTSRTDSKFLRIEILRCFSTRISQRNRFDKNELWEPNLRKNHALK